MLKNLQGAKKWSAHIAMYTIDWLVSVNIVLSTIVGLYIGIIILGEL